MLLLSLSLAFLTKFLQVVESTRTVTFTSQCSSGVTVQSTYPAGWSDPSTTTITSGGNPLVFYVPAPSSNLIFWFDPSQANPYGTRVILNFPAETDHLSVTTYDIMTTPYNLGIQITPTDVTCQHAYVKNPGDSIVGGPDSVFQCSSSVNYRVNILNCPASSSITPYNPPATATPAGPPTTTNTAGPPATTNPAGTPATTNPAGSHVFRITSQCQDDIWVGTYGQLFTPGTNNPMNVVSLPLNGGFNLTRGAPAVNFTVPIGWQGRIWARTGCTQNCVGGKCVCVTGDCGQGPNPCHGATGVPPASLAEFRLDGVGMIDTYDISLVDGYNIPVGISPFPGNLKSGGGTKFDCMSTSCAFQDFSSQCPGPLQVMFGNTIVACKSACAAFDTDEYCCRGTYNDPTICTPSQYALRFGQVCPTAYSYAYNDNAATFTCVSANSGYDVVFC